MFFFYIFVDSTNPASRGKIRKKGRDGSDVHNKKISRIKIWQENDSFLLYWFWKYKMLQYSGKFFEMLHVGLQYDPTISLLNI